MTTRYQRKPNDCEWCCVSEHEITGPALEGELRPAKEGQPQPVVCDECWFGPNGSMRGKTEGEYERV